MMGLEAAAWGLFGGLAVDLMDLAGAIRREGRWPWSRRPRRRCPAIGFTAFATSVLIRGGVSAGLAAASASAGQVTTAFAAITVGVAAPLILQQIGKNAILSAPTLPAAAPQAPESASTTDRTKGQATRSSQSSSGQVSDNGQRIRDLKPADAEGEG